MSGRKHFFYYGSKAADEGRHLPDDRPGETAAARVRAAATLAYTEEETDYAVMAEAILDELVSENARLLAWRSPVSFASLYLLLSNFCCRYETVTALPPPEGVHTVAPVSHGLYFAVATAVHYAASVSLPLTLAMEAGDPPALRLSVSRSSGTEEEAIAALGLDCEGRLPILHRLAEISGFSLSLLPGDETALRFEVPLRPGGTVRLRAVSDPSLEAAFLLPLSIFHY